MTIFYIDPEGGSHYNGGTSFAPIGSGSDAAFDGTYNVHSASFTFLPEHVGHFIAIDSSYYGIVRRRIDAVVDSHNITLHQDMWYHSADFDTPWALEENMPFVIGGRLLSTDYDSIGDSDNPGLTTHWDDEIRLMASPYPRLMGDATWIDSVAYVDFASPVCAVIDLCEANWTVANGASVSSTMSSGRKLHSSSGYASIFGIKSSSVVNTKYWYKTLGATLNLSSWSRISVWMAFESITYFVDDSLVLKLCSDTLGATPIASYLIKKPVGPDSYYNVKWFPVILENGAPLPDGVNSIAIYSGSVAPNYQCDIALANMLAVKAEGDPLEFTHRTLIGKVHNLCWTPSTEYALNTIRKPMQPSRNGFRYKVTSAGTSGTTEPVWPLEEGESVIDGSIVWAVEGPEDTWYPVSGAATGTRVYFDNGNPWGNPTYAMNCYTETETVATYARQPRIARITGGYAWCHPAYASHWDDSLEEKVQTISGGWSRTDMSVMDGESWLDGSAGRGYSIATNEFSRIINLSAVRFFEGTGAASPRNVTLENCHFNGNIRAIGTGGIMATRAIGTRLVGVVANKNYYKAVGADYYTNPGTYPTPFELWAGIDMLRCRFDGNSAFGYTSHDSHAVTIGGYKHKYVYARCNGHNFAGDFAIPMGAAHKVVCEKFRATDGTHTIDGRFRMYGGGTCGDYVFVDYRFKGSSNGDGWANSEKPFKSVGYASSGDGQLVNLTFTDIPSLPGVCRTYTQFAIVDRIADANRRTEFGYAWKISMPLTTLPSPSMRVPYSTRSIQVPVVSGIKTTISIWAKVPEANKAKAFIRCFANDVGGLPEITDSNPTTLDNTYEQLTLEITPTTTGVVDIKLCLASIYHDDGYSAHWVAYFDDLTVE